LHFREQALQPVIELIDFTCKFHRGPNDVVDRQPLRHHPFDVVDATHDAKRIHPFGPAMFPATTRADTMGSRQQPELDVLPEGRLTEADPGFPENFHDVERFDPVFVDPLTFAQFFFGQEFRHRSLLLFSYECSSLSLPFALFF